ncbi:MAG: hypothetical protein IKE77_07265 [Erysipelotrichaceae bacterium]|nr:hypothetical protein [Erysipelotrichaceae bacterium]
MGKTLTLSPQELYFLGTVLEAKYIDYEYIAHMPDIQKRYSVHEQETLSQLADKGYVEEDFSGNVSVSEEISELLVPVFFGEVESKLMAGEPGDKELDKCNFHFLDGKITKVSGEDRLTVIEYSQDKLRKAIEECFNGYGKTAEGVFDGEKIEKIVSVICAKANIGSYRKSWLCMNGTIWQADEKGEPEAVELNKAVQQACEFACGK